LQSSGVSRRVHDAWHEAVAGATWPPYGRNDRVEGCGHPARLSPPTGRECLLLEALAWRYRPVAVIGSAAASGSNVPKAEIRRTSATG